MGSSTGNTKSKTEILCYSAALAVMFVLSALYSTDAPEQETVIEGDTTSLPITVYECTADEWLKLGTSFSPDKESLTLTLSNAYPFSGSVSIEPTESGAHYKFISNGKHYLDFDELWQKTLSDCAL